MKKWMFYSCCTLFSAQLLAEIPHTFSAGTPAKASEVNANFMSLNKAIGDLSEEIQDSVLHCDGAGFKKPGQIDAINYQATNSKPGDYVVIAGESYRIIKMAFLEHATGDAYAIQFPVKGLATEILPAATTHAKVNINLPSDAQVPVLAFDPSNVTSVMYNQSASYTVFDSFGTTHTLTNYFVQKHDPYNGYPVDNQWDQWTFLDGVDISGDSAAGAGNPTIIQFNNTGHLIAPVAAAPLTTGQIEYTTIAVGGGAADLTFTLDYSSTTQYGGDFIFRSFSADGNAYRNGFDSAQTFVNISHTDDTQLCSNIMISGHAGNYGHLTRQRAIKLWSTEIIENQSLFTESIDLNIKINQTTLSLTFLTSIHGSEKRMIIVDSDESEDFSSDIQALKALANNQVQTGLDDFIDHIKIELLP
ncbi:MAG: hypothetical protein HRU20_04540 [Pseudomonadales bacterium]|nr:hypothetical protein [Pseudomonadales bacterium]